MGNKFKVVSWVKTQFNNSWAHCETVHKDNFEEAVKYRDQKKRSFGILDIQNRVDIIEFEVVNAVCSNSY